MFKYNDGSQILSETTDWRIKIPQKTTDLFNPQVFSTEKRYIFYKPKIALKYLENDRSEE